MSDNADTQTWIPCLEAGAPGDVKPVAGICVPMSERPHPMPPASRWPYALKLLANTGKCPEPDFQPEQNQWLEFEILRGKRYGRAMRLFLASLRQPTASVDVETVIEGFVRQSKTDAQAAFSDIVQRALNHTGDDFAAFQKSTGGYESVLFVPVAS